MESGRPNKLRLFVGRNPETALQAIFVKTDNEVNRLAACAQAEGHKQQIAAGKYYEDSGILLKNIAVLAQVYLTDPSPLIEGLTNHQVSLMFVTGSHVLVPSGTSIPPWYHYNGGQFDEFGLPFDLSFTNLDYFYEYAAGAASFEPLNIFAQGSDLICDEVDLDLDDHLAEINVPILYVGAAGGFGSSGVYSAELTASEDVSSVIVQLLPAGYEVADFGHVDLFIAYDADVLVWNEIIDWIIDHQWLGNKL